MSATGLPGRAASFAIQPHAVAHRIACRRGAHMRASAARVANEILELASPVLGSGLGNTGQAGDAGVVTPGRESAARPAALGGAGR